jgi:hypothetical protein
MYQYMITTEDTTSTDTDAGQVAVLLNHLVGQRLFTRRMVGKYFTQKPKRSRIDQYRWKFTLTREKRKPSNRSKLSTEIPILRNTWEPSISHEEHKVGGKVETSCTSYCTHSCKLSVATPSLSCDSPVNKSSCST